MLLEKQFGVPVINEYGASELDLIAFQNQEGDWQVNSETLFVEILDDNDNINFNIFVINNAIFLDG